MAQPPIPMALEELLGMAATTPPFAEVVQRDPRAAAEAAGLELTATEDAILRALDPAQLRRMVDEVRQQLPEPDRRAFFEQAAVAIVALFGGAAGATAAGCGPKKQSGPASTGDQPAGGGASGDGATAMDPPPPPPDAQPQSMFEGIPDMHSPVKGIRPDRQRPSPKEPIKSAGIRLRRPKKKPMRPRKRPRTVRDFRKDGPPPTFGQRAPNRDPTPKPKP